MVEPETGNWRPELTAGSGKLHRRLVGLRHSVQSALVSMISAWMHSAAVRHSGRTAVPS